MYTDVNRKNLRFNFTLGVFDGAFFGLGMGFTSTVTILPLFVSSLSDSTMLVGLIAAMWTVGWHLPQLFNASYVARMRRYKPAVMFFTIQERLPFFGLALIALLVPTLGPTFALILTFLLFGWHSFGRGLSATPWQSLIGKIVPTHRRGTFLGIQGAAASLMAAISGITAGWLLQNLPSPGDFALCFVLAGMALMVSWLLLTQTRESEHEPDRANSTSDLAWHSMWAIIKHDVNFRWFLGARTLTQFGAMAVSFYTIYGVRRFGIDETTAGAMAGVLMIGQTAANPVIGWLGDRWGHRSLLVMGALVTAGSAFIAVGAPDRSWLYLAFALAGLANATIWTSTMSLILEFGSDNERPLYIGLANTLIAPATIVAPVVGGWLADSAGFQTTFLVAAVCAILTALLLQFLVHNPRHISQTPISEPTTAYMET